MATTTTPANVDALLNVTLGGNQDFEVICAGDSVANKKPAPDVYALALERLALPAGAGIDASVLTVPDVPLVEETPRQEAASERLEVARADGPDRRADRRRFVLRNTRADGEGSERFVGTQRVYARERRLLYIRMGLCLVFE